MFECEVLVILVGSAIVCERLQISNIFKSSDVLEFSVFDNRLQFKSPSKYSSEFSASILSIISSNKVNNCWDELGGLYKVPTKKCLERGLEISIIRISRSLFARSSRIRKFRLLRIYIQTPPPLLPLTLRSSLTTS